MKLLFWPTSELPLSTVPSVSWYCPAYCFHGWAAPFVVFRVLVQTHPLCEDAAPDGPWRECRGCAEEKESLQTLCELSPCSISASRFSEKLHKCSFSAQTLTNENIFILFILIHSLTFAFFFWHGTTYNEAPGASSATNSWKFSLRDVLRPVWVYDMIVNVIGAHCVCLCLAVISW